MKKNLMKRSLDSDDEDEEDDSLLSLESLSLIAIIGIGEMKCCYQNYLERKSLYS